MIILAYRDIRHLIYNEEEIEAEKSKHEGKEGNTEARETQNGEEEELDWGPEIYEEELIAMKPTKTVTFAEDVNNKNPEKNKRKSRVLPASAYVSDPYPSCSPLAQVPSYFALDILDCLTP